jgi:hypothetical protein
MLVKHNNNSISDITSAGQLAQGKMTLISSQTASGSASISFTSGIDSTYPIYRFEFINIHPSIDSSAFRFNASTDGGSNYNVVKTTTSFDAIHKEDGSGASLSYKTGNDHAQSSDYQVLAQGTGADNDQSNSGYLYLFNPSSTTFVKHFMATINEYAWNDYNVNQFYAGYFNTTSSINAIDFKYTGGVSPTFSGTIKLYGIGE